MKHKILTITLALALSLAAFTVSHADKTDLHLLVISQDQDAEVEVTVGDQTKTEDLNAGLNCLTYTYDPDVSILAYGDEIELIPVRGNDGDMYALTMIGAPEVENGVD